MAASRRVRARFSLENVGRYPRPVMIVRIEYPHISSRCAGRPDVWEWRIVRALYARAADYNRP